jgi:hypothetical protein
MMKIDIQSDINRGYAEAMNDASTDRFMLRVLEWHFAAIVLLIVANSTLQLSPRTLPRRFSTAPQRQA